MKTITIGNSCTTGKSLLALSPKAVTAVCASLAIAGLVSMFSPSEAQAFSCARNAFGAGCIGSSGAVGLNRGGLVAVGRYGNVYAYRRGSACYWRNNLRICP